MRTVLIYSYECVPYNRPGSTIGAQRPYQFAKLLPNFGWRTIVLCCDHQRRGSVVRSDLSKVVAEAKAHVLESENTNSLIIPLPSLKYADLIDKIWWKFTDTNYETGT